MGAIFQFSSYFPYLITAINNTAFLLLAWLGRENCNHLTAAKAVSREDDCNSPFPFARQPFRKAAMIAVSNDERKNNEKYNNKNSNNRIQA